MRVKNKEIKARRHRKEQKIKLALRESRAQFLEKKEAAPKTAAPKTTASKAGAKTSAAKKAPSASKKKAEAPST